VILGKRNSVITAKNKICSFLHVLSTDLYISVGLEVSKRSGKSGSVDNNILLTYQSCLVVLCLVFEMYVVRVYNI